MLSVSDGIFFLFGNNDKSLANIGNASFIIILYLCKVAYLLCTIHIIIKYSTFANVEVKEFKEVREVKAICFIAKYTTKKAIGYNF